MTASALPYQSVLLTGARGFVGRYLVRSLKSRLSSRAIVHSLDRSGKMPVDLLDEEAVRNLVAFAKPDLVIHLAAQSSVGQSSGLPANTWSVNLGGSVNLANAVANECPGATFAFSSSAEIYGSAFNNGRVDETTAPAPQSVYARTKRAAEEALADTLHSDNRLIIFRPTNHSGAGQDERFVLPAFAKQVAAIEAGRMPSVMQVGTLTAERDFLDVRDVVDAYLQVLSASDANKCQTYNISSGKPVSIARILEYMLEESLATIKVEQDPDRVRPSEIKRTEVSSERIREMVKWHPRIELRETIKDVLKYYREM